MMVPYNTWGFGNAAHGTKQHLQDLKTINLLCRKYYARFSEVLQKKEDNFQEKIQDCLRVAP